jgi:hypothetical protein
MHVADENGIVVETEREWDETCIVRNVGKKSEARRYTVRFAGSLFLFRKKRERRKRNGMHWWH